jgi:hypothetical protein
MSIGVVSNVGFVFFKKIIKKYFRVILPISSKKCNISFFTLINNFIHLFFVEKKIEKFLPTLCQNFSAQISQSEPRVHRASDMLTQM